MVSSSLKTIASLLVAINLVTSHPLEKWVEQSKAPDSTQPQPKGLGTGGGVGGYHGVFRHHNHGQSSGRGFDASHDLPRKPVEGFSSQDQQGHVPSQGPKDSNYEQKHVSTDQDIVKPDGIVPAIHDVGENGPSPNNRPNGPSKPAGGNIKPLYYEDKDKNDFVTENPNTDTREHFLDQERTLSQDKDHGISGTPEKPNIEITKPESDLPTKYEPLNPEGPVYDGNKNPVKPDVTNDSQDKYPLNPDTEGNPESPVYTQEKYPLNPDGPVKPEGGDKYPVKPEGSSPTNEYYPDKAEDRPVEPTQIGDGPINTRDEYQIKPEGQSESGDKYPVKPEDPSHSGVIPEGPICVGDKCPTYPEVQSHSEENFPVNPEGTINSGEKYPINPEGSINNGNKYPTNPEGPINNGNKYPTNPEGPINSGDNYPINPEGPLNGGEKLPENPEGPIGDNDKYPVNPERPVYNDNYPVKPNPTEDKTPINPIHTQEKAPLEPEDHIQRGEKFPTKPEGPIQREDKYPLKPESHHHHHSHENPTENNPVKPIGNSNTPADDVQVQGNQEFIPNQPFGEERPKDSAFREPEQPHPQDDVPEKAFGVPGESRPIVPDEPTGASGSLDPEKPFGPSDEGAVKKDTIPKQELPVIRDLCQSLDLKRFLTLINRAEMGDIFSSKAPITIFAPSDAAFSRLPVHVYYRLTRDNAFLKQVLKYHIIEGVHPESGEVDAKLEGVRFYQTQEPKMKLFFNSYGGNYYVNGLPITKASQRASNGMIHVIDNVLYPLPSKNIAETMQATSTFTRFYALAQEAGLFEDQLLETKGPRTIFVPSDAAFAKLPRRTLEWLSFDKPALKTLLLKHIVPGTHFSSWVPETGISYTTLNPDVQIEFKHEKDHYTVNGVRIGNHDIVAQDGVIHSVNEVLFTKDLQPKVDYRRPSLKRIYPSSPTSS